MRKLVLAGLAAAALFWGPLGASPAFAFRVPEPNAAWPTPHQLESRYDDSRQPYAMSYSEEAARRLGVADGSWQAFGTPVGDSSRFSLKGGLDSRGAVLRLQW